MLRDELFFFLLFVFDLLSLFLYFDLFSDILRFLISHGHSCATSPQRLIVSCIYNFTLFHPTITFATPTVPSNHSIYFSLTSLFLYFQLIFFRSLSSSHVQSSKSPSLRYPLPSPHLISTTNSDDN